MSSVHVPVLRAEVLSFLEGGGSGGRIVVDATFGGGGHTAAILERYADVRVIAIDQDEQAVRRGAMLAGRFPGRLTIIEGNFRDIDSILAAEGVGAVDAVLADIGVSSDLVEDGARGFSFQQDGPLDMRMSGAAAVTAAQLVNGLGRDELADLIYRFGEETRARQIARAIVESRRKARIETTAQLAGIVRSVVHGAGRVHPATRTFQALRIAVNDELGALEEFLGKSVRCLANGGRLLVITFHSLEDRIVKNFLRDGATNGMLRLVTKKAVMPGRGEVLANRRSRSAKLRVAEKSGAAA